MNDTYKTIFIDVEVSKKMNSYGQLNGDQLARDIGGALNHPDNEDYELERLEKIVSMSHNVQTLAGYLLILKRKTPAT